MQATDKQIKTGDPSLILTLMNEVSGLTARVEALEKIVKPKAVPIIVDYVPNPPPMPEELLNHDALFQWAAEVEASIEEPEPDPEPVEKDYGDLYDLD